MRRTLEYGDLEVGIDGWGGVHIDFSEADDIEESIGLSPLMVEDITAAREEVLRESDELMEDTEDTDG